MHSTRKVTDDLIYVGGSDRPKLYCRIFSKKLCYDLVWLYHDFSVLGICLLVCERKKQTCIYAISIDFSSIV